MRFRNSFICNEMCARLYKTGILNFSAKTKRLITCERMYVDWIGKKIIFTPTDADDGYSFKITKGRSNWTLCCGGLKKILPEDENIPITENEDGTFWIPALEEAEE